MCRGKTNLKINRTFVLDFVIMDSVIHAIYENGIIRPFEPIDLENGEEVDVFLVRKESYNPEHTRRLLKEIAELPIEGNPEPFSGTNHDEILYPKQQ